MKKRRVGRGKAAVSIYTPPLRKFFDEAWLAAGFQVDQVVLTCLGRFSKIDLYDKIVTILGTSTSKTEIVQAISILNSINIYVSLA